jgi:hypothetical protein
MPCALRPVGDPTRWAANKDVTDVGKGSPLPWHRVWTPASLVARLELGYYGEGVAAGGGRLETPPYGCKEGVMRP